MRVAIVGSGVSGLVAAHHLHGSHDITVFEAGPRLGGHTHTVAVEEDGRSLGIDTGFIVFNHRNYPRFSALLQSLGVASHESDMSFSVRDERSGLEYRGSSLNSLFAQRRNLVSPAFHRMFWEIVRFYREARADVRAGAGEQTLHEYVTSRGYSRMFVEDHLVPMACALWSSNTEEAASMPMRFLVRFFENHGMMQFRDRPQWRVVTGGSRSYVEALTQPLTDRIRLNAPVEKVRRTAEGLELRVAGEDGLRFDRVVMALHGDQALRILEDPTPDESAVLGSIRYRANDVVLHTDTRMLPKTRRAWSSWNYHVTSDSAGPPRVTYYMNMLQRLRCKRHYMVTLNRTHEIDPRTILLRQTFDHPLFDADSVAAQEHWERVDGIGGIHYCGAYWGFGFHEDGVQSAERVVEHLRKSRRAA